MAAEKYSVENVTILVDDVELQVPKGEIIIESLKRVGIETPIFCYHPRMKPVGMCRMCLVDTGMKQPDGTIRKMPKPQASCTLPASEGLAIYTNTPQVIKDRQGIIEFLLINHPLDCPICDRGGECPLQNNTQFYGHGKSRYIEMKRHAPKAVPLSDFITLDLERCIQCGRCVRFTEEISGDAELALRFRGASMQPSTFSMSVFESKFSGNTIEVCPVGALTSSKSRFRARPWDLESSKGICTLCSCGCNVWFDHRVGKLTRVTGRTNEEVNEEWTCDRGKFGHDHYNEERQGRILIRNGAQLESDSWGAAYGAIDKALQSAGERSAFLMGAQQSNESVYLAGSLAVRGLGSKWIGVSNGHAGAEYAFDDPADTLVSLEHSPVICSVGASMADTLPIAYLRVRKAWGRHGAKVISIHSAATEFDAFAEVSLLHAPGQLPSVLRGLSGEIPLEKAAEISQVDLNALAKAKALLESQPGSIVTTRRLAASEGNESLNLLKAFASQGGHRWNLYHETASGTGAMHIANGLGVTPSSVELILKKCVEGEVRFLWLAGIDPFEIIGDRELVKRALEEVEFLVVQTPSASEAINYASVVLPQLYPGEGGGSFTNLDGHIQDFEPCLPRYQEAKADWQILAEFTARRGGASQLYAASDVFAQLAAEIPFFKRATVALDSLTPSEVQV